MIVSVYKYLLLYPTFAYFFKLNHSFDGRLLRACVVCTAEMYNALDSLSRNYRTQSTANCKDVGNQTYLTTG